METMLNPIESYQRQACYYW